MTSGLRSGSAASHFRAWRVYLGGPRIESVVAVEVAAGVPV